MDIEFQRSKEYVGAILQLARNILTVDGGSGSHFFVNELRRDEAKLFQVENRWQESHSKLENRSNVRHSRARVDLILDTHEVILDEYLDLVDLIESSCIPFLQEQKVSKLKRIRNGGRSPRAGGRRVESIAS